MKADLHSCVSVGYSQVAESFQRDMDWALNLNFSTYNFDSQFWIKLGVSFIIK